MRSSYDIGCQVTKIYCYYCYYVIMLLSPFILLRIMLKHELTTIA